MTFKGATKDWDIEDGSYVPTREDLKEVIDANPDLCSWGLLENYEKERVAQKTSDNSTFESLKEEMDGNGFYNMFKFCCWWLAMLDKGGTPNWDSYEMKHIAERHYEKYVINGAMVAAAIFLDYPYQRERGGEGVIKIGVKKKGWFYRYTMALQDEDNSKNTSWLNKPEQGIVMKYMRMVEQFTYRGDDYEPKPDWRNNLEKSGKELSEIA